METADVRNVFSGGLEQGTRWLQLLVSMAGCWCITEQGSAEQNCWAGCGWWLTLAARWESLQSLGAFPWCCSHTVPHGVPTSTASPHGCTGFNSRQLRCLSFAALDQITLPVQLWGFFLSHEMMKYISGTYIVLTFIDLYFLGDFTTYGAFIRPDAPGVKRQYRCSMKCLCKWNKFLGF